MAEAKDTLPVRVRQCAECGVQFSYPVRRGTDRIYCGNACAALVLKRRSRLRPLAKCSVGGCENGANRVGVGMCEAHYMRQRRKGTTDLREVKQRYMHSAGYVVVRRPDHPLLKGRQGQVEYEHRIVYYDAHGAGPFSCAHCGKTIGWSDMHVDHLNDDKTDNRIDNLVASCPVCNQRRGHHKASATTRRVQGLHLTHNGETMTSSEWARRLGMSRTALMRRLRSGWAVDAALSTQPMPRGPRSVERVNG